ncbi:protein FAF-like, chloroplastic [Neltuma alba]|uniref:protein FAF-like, chloroplastic n=1 Tax=Neltuma alba TaxID=207710 RepID=UPI0010A5773F|nr:protein FAF-like, chloroplastic [Prosopis alba]XP_028808337.1 protein FAF-like, chloroplastic [Prosopis alba]
MAGETRLAQKQGIVTILSSDYERNRASSSPSLRRTLSADMSSKKWLSQNGFFSPMKKTVSSQRLSHSETIVAASAADSCSSSESDSSDDCEERKDLEAESIGSTIRKDKNKESEKPGAFDIWSSIVSQKTNEDASKSSLPPPYIHPLVKRSQSSLSEKSLQICTESLGSETGSDGFSSYPSSETGETEEDNDDEEEESEKEALQEQREPEEDFVVPKFNYSATSKKAGPRSFPPPLPSLTRQDGPSVHMRSRRENGRLVLEAVSVPSQNNFCAHRQDGRLLLTFNNLATNEEFQHDEDDDEEEEYHVDVEEMEQEFGEFKDDAEEENEHEEDDDEEKEEEEIDKREIEQAPILSSGVESVHRLGLTMNKPIGFVNRNPKWSEKLNEVVNSEDVKVVEKSTTGAKSSLPPRPRAARSVPSAPAGATSAVPSFNRYEYFWRAKSTNHPQNSSPLKNSCKRIVSEAINQTPQEQQKLLVLRGKNGDYMVHNWRSCKESRRSFLFWEPHLVATS